MRGPAGEIEDHVTTQCQDHGRLLEEAIRDLEAFKRAYFKAEQEKQALSDEIRRLKVKVLSTTFDLKLSTDVSSCLSIS